MHRHSPAHDRAQVRTALLLAAGLGCRLAPLTDALPKCLVSVSGVPILERLVRSLDSHGIERLVIVTGYKAETIRDYLGERFGGIAIEYIVSPLFATTNNIYSLWLARQLIDEPFLLVESDLVFDEQLLAPLLQPGRIAVSRQLPWMSGTTVTLDGDGNVDAFYPPPPGVYGQHCTDPGHFMAVNICSLARDTWGAVCERLDHHVAAGQTGFFYESVFEEMTADGSMALTAVIFPAERWYEIDTPADLDAAELVFPRQLHVAGRVGAAGPQRRSGGVSGGASRTSAGPAPMLAFARDLPNVCSLAGLLAALLGLFFAIRGVYPAALTALLWAVVFDWSDGLIARRMKGRTADQRAFGAQLDSLIDVVSFSVAPALLLLSVGDFSPWYVPGAFVILATGVIRLSYFNVFGLLDDSTYRGLPLDTNVIVLALLFVFEPLVGVTTFAVVLYVAMMLLAALNVAPIATPKLGGRWYYAVIVYALVLSGVYALQLR